MVSSELHRRSGCPACGSPLPTPEDAVVINLKPTEEYKTTILSGLPPSMIMECAGRAMNFWVYQTIQDRHYQEHLFKSLSEQHKGLKTRLQQTEHNAQVESEDLKRKIHGRRIVLALDLAMLTNAQQSYHWNRRPCTRRIRIWRSHTQKRREILTNCSNFTAVSRRRLSLETLNALLP